MLDIRARKPNSHDLRVKFIYIKTDVVTGFIHGGDTIKRPEDNFQSLHTQEIKKEQTHHFHQVKQEQHHHHHHHFFHPLDQPKIHHGINSGR
jgi:hypothetical protein